MNGKEVSAMYGKKIEVSGMYGKTADDIFSEDDFVIKSLTYQTEIYIDDLTKNQIKVILEELSIQCKLVKSYNYYKSKSYDPALCYSLIKSRTVDVSVMNMGEGIFHEHAPLFMEAIKSARYAEWGDMKANMLVKFPAYQFSDKLIFILMNEDYSNITDLIELLPEKLDVDFSCDKVVYADEICGQKR